MRRSKYPKAINISNSQIDRYGNILRSSSTKTPEYREAFDVISEWRASHLYPLNTFRSTLSRKTFLMKNVVIAQRLKRMPTIIEKLNRQEKNRNEPMRLSAMQDIGGLRMIADNLDDVYRIKKYYCESRLSHVLKKSYDYIIEPKPDGYRGIHLVFQYHGMNDVARQYDGLLIEMQLRTRLQHTWATAVEVAGLMIGEKLKNDEGDSGWLEFFLKASKAFEAIEYLDKDGKKYIKKPDLNSSELYRSINILDKKLHALDSLSTFSNAMKFIDPSHRNYKYYIVEMNPLEKSAKVYGYEMNEYNKAVKKYAEMERRNLGTSIDQVLVSAGSLKKLQIAYPNYFADIRDFVSKINSLEKTVEY